MILRLILALAVLVGGIYLVRYFRKQSKPRQKQLAVKYGSLLLAGILLLLIVSGRVHWISAIFAALIPAGRYLFPLALKLWPFLSHWHRNRASKNMHSGNDSQVQTDYLTLSLDHDTGDISGTIIAGLYEGRSLAQLTHTEARELLDFYAQRDGESYKLLFAYLQRTYGEDAFQHTGEQANRQQATDTGAMSRREALDILGLDEGASEDDIEQSYKKLIQKLHPDRGGSNYLAAKINEAKTFLLEH